jgi:hypothetical protein
MDVLERIASYYSKKCNRKNEVLKECTLLAPEIFRILRSKYPYLGDIRIMNFGWTFSVRINNKDNSDLWGGFVFPMNNLDYEFEDCPEIIAFNNKLKAYMDWDYEMDNMLYHKIKDNYQYLDRFLYSQGYMFNICSHLYDGGKNLILCTNGNDYITIDCIEKKIVEIKSYEELNAEVLGEKWEKINSFDWDNLKRI